LTPNYSIIALFKTSIVQTICGQNFQLLDWAKHAICCEPSCFSSRKVFTMLTFRHLLASLALTVAFAGAASADVSNFNKVVLDKNGSPVGDVRGGCVVANGENTTGACRAATPAPVAKPVAQRPVAKPATPVPSQESRTIYFDFNKPERVLS
jgi:hypothetical protein